MAEKGITSVGIVVKPDHAEAMATAGEISAWLADHDVALSGEPVSALAESEGYRLPSRG